MPDKLAMLHISKDKTERRLPLRLQARERRSARTTSPPSASSAATACCSCSSGITSSGLRCLGLHKLGAVGIPATYLLQEHDYAYRFEKAGVSAILCTADEDAAETADRAARKLCGAKRKSSLAASAKAGTILTASTRVSAAASRARRTRPAASDLMLMFFTSGTTGQPKLAAHTYKYPLGHHITAEYWQCVNPNGLHLTISDTGWAKAMWGKLYGQWLSEAAVFVYDFDRFDAADILPMFAKYNITTRSARRRRCTACSLRKTSRITTFRA